MKAVPKVNTDGLYLEDVVVDDTFAGVVPFYADPEPVVFDPEQIEQPQPTEEEEQEEVEREIAGYLVGIPVTPGLYRPRFDLEAWEAYNEDEANARAEYQTLYDAWLNLPEEEREDAPKYESLVMPELWIEGLSQEEIDELTKPQPTEPTELEKLIQENILLKAQNAALAERADFIEDVIAEMAAQVYQ